MGCSDNMLSKIVSLSLVTVVCCQWPAAVPTVPGNIPGLQEGTLGAAQWWSGQIAHAGQVAHHVGKRQAALRVVPGNIPGLVAGSPAADAWWRAQIAHAGQVAHHVGKRQAEILNIPGGAVYLQNQIIWQQQQINDHHVGKRQAEILNIPGGAQFLLNQLAWQQQQANHVGKRSAGVYPAGVSAASCPNYPYCNLAPIVPVGYVNTAGYPAGVSPALCANYPYCS